MTSRSPLPLPWDSSTIGLAEQTSQERVKMWKLNGESFQGPLSSEDYLQREQRLSDQALTRNGSMSFWVLTDLTQRPNERPLLSSCETIRRRASVKKPDDEVKPIMIYGIASVFCPPAFRGNGFASKMMELLGQELDDRSRSEGHPIAISILYSDTGKDFYSNRGWGAFKSEHIVLSPKQSSLGTSIKHLYASDIETLCKEDEQSLHDFLQKSCSAQVTVALLPDATTMAWHHAREEFIALRLFDTRPEVKGALTHCGAQKTWCIWTHTFADDPSGNVLHLLRIAIPDNDGQITSDIEGSADRTTHAQDRDDKVAAIMRLLTAAQAEAVAWQMKAIHIWDPSAIVMAAAQTIDEHVNVTVREQDSIASLRVGADKHSGEPLTWSCNEKYGWC